MSQQNNWDAQIVFIDSAVDDYPSLVKGVVSGVEVIVLTPTLDGVTQISEVLARRLDIATVHIVSHGSPGCLYLGNTQLSLDTLGRYAAQLQTWFSGLLPQAIAPSLLLYGCNVAAGDAGEEFVEQLCQSTGAHIAASARRIGNSAKGGSWHLERRLGQISAGSAFLPERMEAYPGVFNISFSNDGKLLGSRSNTQLGNFTDAVSQPFQTLKLAKQPKPLLTILWDPHRPDNPAPTRELIEAILYGATNSVQDYYLENSNGQFTINNAGILGWYDADKSADHYWNHPQDANDGWLDGHREKWAEAIRKADQDFNFSTYDGNSNGNLTPDELGILIVIPQNSPFGTNRLAVGLESPPMDLIVDGVKIAGNGQGNNIAELYIGNPPNPGVVAHELGHLLLEHSDMYFDQFSPPILQNSPFRPGDYSIMDVTYKTTHFDPFAKLKFGWVQPNEVSQPGYYDITDVETNHNIWVLIDPQKGTDEYFIVENRWPGNSYDREMSDSGLAVWHVIEKPEIYGSQIPPTPLGFDQASWEAGWSTVSAGDWGRRAIRMIKPVWNNFDNSQALWDGSDPATGYNLLANNPDPQKASLRWADGTPSGFAIENIPSAAATMRVFIDFKLTVDTLVDENDGDFSAGDVSLREAIALSKAGGTIDFASSLAGGTISLSLGELAINKDLTINGLGSDKLTVSGNKVSRVFNINDRNLNNLINVEIKGLTIANGKSSGNGGGISNTENLTITDSTIKENEAEDGGGVFSRRADRDDTIFGERAMLTINNSIVQNNKATDNGGGINNRQSTATLNNSEVINNTAGDEGGGIANEDQGILNVLDRSTISGNSALGDPIVSLEPNATIGVGGGIINNEGSKLVVRDSTIFGNTAKVNLDNQFIEAIRTDRLTDIVLAEGGGIFNGPSEAGLEDSVAEVINTTISGNTAGDASIKDFITNLNTPRRNLNAAGTNGGGVSNRGVLTLTGKIISVNTAGDEGGGIFNSLSGVNSKATVTNTIVQDNKANDGGGISNETGMLTVIGSTISGNTAIDDAGGIQNSRNGTLTVNNSTISGNTANKDGGGIENEVGTLMVNDTTITNNTAGAMPGDRTRNGGGIFTQSGGTINNTIIAGNIDKDSRGILQPDVSGSFTNTSSNLIGDGTGSTGFTNGVNGNQVGTSTNPIDSKLGPLQNNGGPTFTHALLPDSPAINKGNNADIPPDSADLDGDGDTTEPLPFDQRGNPRIVSGTVDIGAFEAPLPTGSGGKIPFVINRGDSKPIADFGGIGTGINPSPPVLAEVDTLKFVGAGLTARNLLLTQNGADLEIAFEGVADTKVTLENFAIENLENLTRARGATVDLGNILFNGQNSIQDSFDVVNANFNQPQIFNRNTVTFLNDLNNDILGFDNSNDVINGQGGDDVIDGLSGNDVLRGGEGKNFLFAGTGSDILVGGFGNDFLDLGVDRDIDTVVYRSGDGSDTVRQFNRGRGGDLLDFQNIPAIDVVVNGSSTLFRLSDGIDGNEGFGTGDPFLRLSGTAGFTAANLGLNLVAGNTTQFLFA